MTPVTSRRWSGACSRIVMSIAFAQAFGSAPAAAQGVPSAQTNPLLEICSSMLEQSGGVSGSKDRLCACLVHETSTQLTHAEMVAYASATQKGQSPPPAVMNKITAIASNCLSAQ